MLIKNGTVYDGLGNCSSQDIRIEDSIIKEMGPLSPFDGEEIFDADGMIIMPGFIQPISNWGVNGSMTEIRPSSNDNDERSNPITPELDGFYAFNGRAVTAQQLGAFGVTSFGLAPTYNNLFGGTIAAFCAEGLNPYKMCLGRDLGMMASVDQAVKNAYASRQMAPMTRMWIFANFSEQLRKAAEYKEEADKPFDEKLASLRRVIDGQMPLFVSCDLPSSLEHVREITETYPKLKLVIVNGFGLTGEESWIIERKIPVIARTASCPLESVPSTLSFKALASFIEAGVPVAMSGTYATAFGAREDMLWNGIELMREMHDTNKVLPALTSVPAKILGIFDLTGSIETGKRADLVIWSGDPLKSYTSQIIHTFMGGQIIFSKGDELKCM